jgi:hypothetical protein
MISESAITIVIYNKRKWLLRLTKTVTDVARTTGSCGLVTHMPPGREQAPNPANFSRRGGTPGADGVVGSGRPGLWLATAASPNRQQYVRHGSLLTTCASTPLELKGLCSTVPIKAPSRTVVLGRLRRLRRSLALLKRNSCTAGIGTSGSLEDGSARLVGRERSLSTVPCSAKTKGLGLTQPIRAGILLPRPGSSLDHCQAAAIDSPFHQRFQESFQGLGSPSRRTPASVSLVLRQEDKR